MIICADDFGLRDDVNRSILELAGSGKLSAVSCMPLLNRCTPASLAELRRHEASVDIGLHLCFTDEGLPLSSPGGGPPRTEPLPAFKVLLRRSLRGQLRREDAAREIGVQYELFLAKAGRAPDYIDGHLHVHQLPGLREGLVDFVSALPAHSRPYIRNTCLPLKVLWRQRLPWVKSAFIGAFGKRLRRLLAAGGIWTNDGFAGIYDFNRWTEYPGYFPKFIACLENSNGILVVHPGTEDDWRRQELAVLRDFPFGSGLPNRFRAQTQGGPSGPGQPWAE